MINLNENEVNYFYCLKLAKIFNRDEEYNMIRSLFYSLKGGVIDSSFFAKMIEKYRKEIVSTPNKSIQILIGDIFSGLKSKQEATNIISLLSIIENSVNNEDYELANVAKSEILRIEGVTDKDYFKMFKFFVTDYPVKYDL